MNIKPLHDRVLIKPETESVEKSDGGIIIPDTAKTKPSEGEVIAIGSGTKSNDGTLVPLDVKVGDRVFYSKYAGSELKIPGGEALLMREDDILAIIS